MFARYALVFGSVAALLSVSAAASAHEGREVGEYEFTVGFLSEPAYEGEPNGVSLRIEKHGDDVPVEGVASSVKAEVTHVPTGTKKEMTLRGAFGDPGHYVSNFIPTSPGVYTFRFTGEISGFKFDESFTSGPGTFSEVAAARDVQFPVQVGSGREIEGVARSTQSVAQSAEDAVARAYPGHPGPCRWGSRVGNGRRQHRDEAEEEVGAWICRGAKPGRSGVAS